MNTVGKQICFLFLLLFLGADTKIVFSQEVSSLFRHFSTENGVPSSEVYVVHQDKSGNLWFGTDRGLARYDGYEFKTYTAKDGLADHTVFKLQEDYHDRLWMLTYSGRLFYLEDGKINPYKYNQLLLDSTRNKVPSGFFIDSLENVEVTFQGAGELFVSGAGKATWKSWYGNDPKINFEIDETEPEHLQAVVLTTFEGTRNAFLNYVGRGKPRQYVFATTSSNRFIAMRLTAQQLIFSQRNILYELTDQGIRTLNTFAGNILSINKDRHDRVWIGTEGGCFVFSASDLTSVLQQHLKDCFVTDILEDHEGGFWLTTLNNGIYYTAGYGILGIQFKQEALRNPICLATDHSSSIYIGFWNGSIMKFSKGKFASLLQPVAGSIEQPVMRLSSYPGDDHIYISRALPSFLKADKQVFFKYRVPMGVKTAFYKSQTGDLYCAGSVAIFKIYGDSLIMHGNADQRINCFSETPDHRLLIGGSRGVYIFDSISQSSTVWNKKLIDFRVEDLKWMKNHLLIATKGRGLLVLSGDSLVQIDESKGLCSDLINKIEVEGMDAWCTSNKGISHLQFRDGVLPDYSITNIRSNNGLLSDEINDIELLHDTIFAATNQGISFFRSDLVFTNFTHPPVYITSLRVNNVDTSIRRAMEFSYGQNTIQIGFNGISFRSNEKIVYRYLLSNGKDTLSSLTTNREVEFLSLRPGNYTFRVEAMNASGIWSALPAALSFRILPPWWQTTWFMAIVVVVLTSLLFVFYRSRMRRVESEYAMERKQASLHLTAIRAQMNPHFIFNVMNSIRNYMQNHDMKSAEKYLTSFSKLVRYTLDTSDVMEVTLQEELNALRNYTELEMQRFDKGFEFTIAVDKELDLSEVMLPSLLLQPFVENAIVHGIARMEGTGRIQVVVRQHAGTVYISVEDNGVGMVESSRWNAEHRETHSSHGTLLTKERIEAYNKAFNKNIRARIIDLGRKDPSAQGTRVEIEI